MLKAQKRLPQNFYIWKVNILMYSIQQAVSLYSGLPPPNGQSVYILVDLHPTCDAYVLVYLQPPCKIFIYWSTSVQHAVILDTGLPASKVQSRYILVYLHPKCNHFIYWSIQSAIRLYIGLVPSKGQFHTYATLREKRD